MSSDEYRAALDAATREYEVLLAERARIDARIAQLAQTIGSLMRLWNLQPTVSWGLTDAVRSALQAAGHPLSALEVREQLAAIGFDLSRYANDLASIHTVLKRLNQAGEVDFVPRAHDKPGYRWRKPIRTIGLTRDEAARLFGTAVARRAGTRRKK